MFDDLFLIPYNKTRKKFSVEKSCHVNSHVHDKLMYFFKINLTGL